MPPFTQMYSTEAGNSQNLLFESDAQPTTQRYDAQKSYAVGISCKDISALFKIRMKMQMPQQLLSPAPPPRRHYTRWWCNMAKKALGHCRQSGKSDLN